MVDASNNWVVYEGMTYTSSGGTFTSGTEKSSGGTIGSTVTAYVGVTGNRILQTTSVGSAPISGLYLEYVDDDSVKVSIGKAVVDGQVLTLSSAYTTGNMASLSANTLYYVYLFDDAGTVKIDLNSTAPSYDVDLGYFSSGGSALAGEDGGAAAIPARSRCIGAWLTDSASDFFFMDCTPSQANSSHRRFQYVFSKTDNNGTTSNAKIGDLTVASWGSATKFSLSNCVPSIASEWLLNCAITTTSGSGIIGAAFSNYDISSHTPVAFTGNVYARLQNDGTGAQLVFPVWVNYVSSDVWYNVSGATATIDTACKGFGMHV